MFRCRLEWDKHLPSILLALRTVSHESTGYTPSELVYGKNLRTPETLVMEHWMEPEEEDKFDDDIQKVTPARAPLAFSLLSNSALMSKSFSFDLLRLRAKTAWLWLPQTASLTVRSPQRYVHRV
ncbi:hypothetical protein TNCV_1688441 [Trichonephila clavipes]|nr:hypothetical protein TNCV_1688441 [Trichonephila clavipes]